MIERERRIPNNDIISGSEVRLSGEMSKNCCFVICYVAKDCLELTVQSLQTLNL